ncbi:T9SS type B sorting domain-containing protein [Bizionia sp. KMM 8389]
MKKITLSILFGLISLLGFSQIGLVENFDAGLTLPPGWTGEGYTGSVFQPCTVVSLRANLSDTNFSDFLISPNIVGDSNGTDLTVAFDYKIVDWSAAVDATGPGWGELNIQYSTDNGGSWVTMGTVNDTNHVTSNTCNNISFVLPAADIPTGSDFKLRFENNYFSGNYYFYIDNVTATQVVVDPPSCISLIEPTNGASGVSINSNLSWTTATNVPQGYTLSVGTTPGGTELVDNLNVGLSTTYDLPVLEYSTVYYVSIIPFNGNGPALNCPEFSFTTGADPNAPVDCDSGIPVNTVFCYTSNETTTWSFQSSSGGPLNVFFNSGTIEACCDEVTIYDGTDNTGTVLYDGNNGGDMTGVSVNSTTGFLFIEIDSDSSVSCAQSSTYESLDFDVSCLDLTALPNCNASLTEPLNGAIGVGENTNLTWSAASILVTGYTINMGTTPGGTDVLNNFDVGNVLTYDPGVLVYDQTYYVTIIPYNDNGPAEGCNEENFTVKADPNQVVDCDINEVINTVHCYENNEITEWWFASSNGNPISITFNAGVLDESAFSGNSWDDLFIYEGTDNTGTLLYDSNDGIIGNSDLTGLTFVSNSGNLYLFFDSNGFTDCESSDDIVPMDFDVACVDTTALPNCNASLALPAIDGAIDIDEDQDLNWTAASVLVTGYRINMGTTPGGTDVLDNVDVGNVLTYDPGTLNYETTYYVTIIPYNDNGSATGCTEESFTVRNNPFQIVDCDINEIVNTVFCYENGTNTFIETFSFESSNGNPLNMFFNSGTIESCCDNIRITEADGTVIYEGNNGGDLAGLSLTSDGDTMIMYYESDSSVSCESGSRTPWDFDVSCVDVDAVPNCNAALLEPLNGTLDVNENMDLTWSVASVLVDGYTLYMGTTPGGTDVLDGVDVGDVLTYDPGLLAYGTTYYVTIIPYNANGPATGCTEESFTVRADPNQTVDCEAGQVVNTVHCYENGNNQYEEIYSFQSTSGYPLNILFNSGTIETCCDTIRIEDGAGNVLYQGTGNAGDLTGLTFTSNDDRIVVFAEADGSVSCESGSRDPWDFDVWCQTCVPQTVTFDVINGDCTTDPDNPVFEVAVDVTDLGDASSLTITDNLGSAPTNVTETGVIVLGPFAANSNVIVTVANSNDPNCTIESNPMAFLCPPPPNPCSIVFAGEDAGVDCDTPETTLEANFHLYGQDTTNYEINAIDTCPTPPVDGATPTSINTDDVWSEVVDLGFDFCFYGGVYNQVIIGSNGVLSFEIENANTNNGWAMDDDDTLPNSTNATLSEANIFGVAHDIDPSVCGSIDYVVLGSSPYRQFVVNYNGVCHFGSACNSNTSTSQIILHESSNNIDIHILSKPTCTSWNDGLAVVGLQSVDDSAATTPPGRNTGVWTVTESESWRFSPSGTPNYTLQWSDEDGNVVGTEDTVTVSPTETTTYTFEVTYDLCTGGQATVSDDVEVVYTNLSTFDASFEMTAGCSTATATVLGDVGGEFTFNPDPADGAVIDADTGEITNGVSGTTYTVVYTVGADNCPAATTETVTLDTAGDASFTLTANCDGAVATILGETGGTFSFNPDPADGAVIDPATGEISNGVSGATYNVAYTISGTCDATTTESVTVLPSGDASFAMTANCTGATATILGDVGGVFEFAPDPADGAVIDPVTGEITNGVPGASYTVLYTALGTCATSTTQDVTIPALEDATFVVNTPECDGVTVTVTGDANGTFTFNPLPTDDATINANTGAVSNAEPDTEYTIEYTTAGPCAVSSTVTFTTDACITRVIPEVITPNDDGFNDTFDLNGYEVSSLEVFNRNGIKVFSKTDGYTNEFRGIADNGDELPVGTYFYVMKYQGGKVKTSWVYINK